MADARNRSDWWHTAALLAAIKNIFASKGKQISARDCHPMEQSKPLVTLRGAQLSILRDVFCQDVAKKK